jgi:hypothetical protein
VVSGVTGIVTVHWYSGFETTVMLVLDAAFAFAVHDPGGPQVTLPVDADLAVAQLSVIDDWIESVRYG